MGGRVSCVGVMGGRVSCVGVMGEGWLCRGDGRGLVV